MNSSEENLHARIADATKYFQSRITYYEDTRKNSRRLYQALQILVILLGGLTPILILWTELPKPLQALPAAMASILGGISGIFHLQEDWVTSKKTAEDLKGELLAFQTRTTLPYNTGNDDSKALESAFVPSPGQIEAAIRNTLK